MPNEGPAHNRSAPKEEKKLLFVLLLTAFIMLVEIVGGYISGSLALLADAGHMFTDVAALGLSWAAARYGRKAPDDRRTFGYQRLKILAAYTNGVLLFFLCGIIVVEAIDRLGKPEPVNGPLMLIIAGIGFLTNLISYVILRDSHNHAHDHIHDHGHAHDHSHDHHTHDHAHVQHNHEHEKKPDLNVHSATLHVLSDMFGSVGALAAALIIMFTGWTQADAILSILVSVLIVYHTWNLLRKTTHILIEGTPDPALPEKIRTTIMENMTGIKDVHHIHVWSLTEKQPIATMDVTIEDHLDTQVVLEKIRTLMDEKLGLNHVTIQIEKGPCTAPNC